MRIVACVFVASCASSAGVTVAPRAEPTVAAPPRHVEVAPPTAGPALTTIAGPGKRILIERAGFDADFRLVYVLQTDGTLVAWKPPAEKAPDWYELRREIAKHVVDFDGYHALYEDGTVAEMRSSGDLVATRGAFPPHAVSVDFRLLGVRCVVDASHALLCASGVREPLRPTGITRARTVRAGRDEACARLDGGDLACWSSDGKTTVRAHDVVAFDVSFGSGCAVTTSGEVSCWGRAPSIDVHDAVGVSLEPNAGCVLRREAAPLCWGGPFHSDPAEVAWLRGSREVAIDRDLVCAIFADRSACRAP